MVLSFRLSGHQRTALKKVHVSLNHCGTTSNGTIDVLVNETAAYTNRKTPRFNFDWERIVLEADLFRAGDNQLVIRLGQTSPGVFWLSECNLVFEQQGVSILERMRKMDQKAVGEFIQAMLTGSEMVHEIRTMIVGHHDVGKTTLTKRLLRDMTPREDITSTDGIDIYVGWSEVDLRTRKWMLDRKFPKDLYKKLGKLLLSYCVDSYNFKKSEHKSVRKQITELFSRHKKQKHVECPPPKHFLKNALEHAEDDDSRETAPVQVWDFGGQVVFYTTHQTFLSARCIYLLVFDLRNGLSYPVPDINLIPGQWTNPETLAFLHFWVNSIITYAGGNYPGFPKIVFVGTHLDKIPENEKTEKVYNTFAAIQDSFEGHGALNNLVIDPELSLNAKDFETGTYDKIRQKILEIAESQPFWGERRPTSWLSFEEILTNLSLSGTHFLTLTKIKILNEANLVYVMSDTELEAFLKFQHCKGNILFFPEQSLREFVILNPAWLIDALKTFITAEKFCKSDSIKDEMWENASKGGILNYTTIELLWKDTKYNEFYENKESILKAMERLDLITVPKEYSQDGENTSVEYYLVPSMISKIASPEEIETIIPDSRSVCVVVTPGTCFLPPAIFHRLVASCLTMWPILQHNNENMLFSGFCGLRMDSFHRLFLQQRQYQILVHICHTRDRRAISRNMYKMFISFIIQTLERIKEVYSQYSFKNENTSVQETSETDLFEIQIPCCYKHLDCLLTASHRNDSDRPDNNVRQSNCQHHDVSHPIWLTYFNQTDVKNNHEVVEVRCLPDCKGLDKSIMKRRPTDQDLCRLSRHLLSPPDILGTALDVPVEMIDNIICSPYLGKHEQNFYLLHYWRDRQKTNFSTLMEALKRTRDTNEHIMCGIHKAHSHQNAEGLLGDKVLQRPTIKDIDFITDRMTPTEAFYLGIELGITLVEMEEVRWDHPNDSLQQKRKMLYKWREKPNTYTRATYGALFEGLCQIGASHVIEELFHQPSEDNEI